MGLFRRRNLVVRARRDELFDIVLAPHLRAALEDAIDQVDDLLDEPDLPVLDRLHPVPYLDDPEQAAAWRLLAGEQLRQARRDSFETMRRIQASSVATDEELWSWMRALNTLRLVLGTALGIEEDGVELPEPPADDPSRPIWELYHLATLVQHKIITGLSGSGGA